MNIQMIGIDHSHASIDNRERFSFTKKQQIEGCQILAEVPGINGAVILSTCNRMELYVSTDGEQQIDLYERLCSLKQIFDENYRDYFVERSGEEAARHLIDLTSGLKSRIIGEDQILTQVKDALSVAREAESTDKVLEVLFRRAVTAGKKVKTEITFSHGNVSAISAAIEQLKKMGYTFENKTCLVIGNGEMGQLTANALRSEGADVTVTVRQYRSGQVKIPSGCSRMNYGDRYDYIPNCDYVVSATSSPNLTIRREELEKICPGHPILFLDLAVPRDIEPEIRQLDQVELMDIDSFVTDVCSAELLEQMRQAEKILQEEMQEFLVWYDCRDIVPVIQEIGRNAAADMTWRMGRVLSEESFTADQRSCLEQEIDSTAQKVINKLLFRLRDELDTETLRACLDILKEN